ncbi:hypothetical protein ACFVTF_27290 [Kitasatospora sp. NPDC057940]|uniref:hypothetical protein n=1 Tax=Kitasatospora sp. NPDC057940 TaxID=3346285 RepID=UPI0036DE34DC
MKIWTERPAKADVEAVVRRYFSLLRAGRIPEAEELVDHTSVRHVLKSLWTGSVKANADADENENADENEASASPATDAWERDSSWLRELDLADFHWGHEGTGFYVEFTYRARIIEVSLSFWVKPTDAGWVLAGPATLW